MIFLDTGYLLAFVRSRDALHQRARAWARTIQERCVVTDYVLLETANGLCRPADRPKFHALLRGIEADPNIEKIPAGPLLWKAGIDLHAQRPDKKWSLTDCISFVLMEQRGITRALAHDQTFEQAGFEALLRRDPP